MKIKYVPTVIADIAYNFAPGYVFHDIKARDIGYQVFLLMGL